MLPNARKKTRGHVSCLKNLNQWPETSRSSFSYFSSIYFQCPNHQPTVFITTLKSNFNSPFLTSLKSFVRRKPIPVFDPRLLYCSSLTTAVGGTKDTNFVDSDHPTVARIKWRRCRGWCLSAFDELWNSCDPHHKYW